MNYNDCPKCVIDPDTGSPICTVNEGFVYDGMCEKCEQEEQDKE